jgi:S1-C subfamily serine protease
LVLALTLGVVVLVVSHSQSRAADARDHPANPLTDERASAEVIDAALELTAAAGLRDPAGGYAFRSCNSAEGPPYQATIQMTFAVPQGNSTGYLNDVASSMIGLGWTNAESRAEHFGRKLTRAGLTAVFYRNTERTDVATMRVTGECRVVSDHRADDPAWIELTDRLRTPK